MNSALIEPFRKTIVLNQTLTVAVPSFVVNLKATPYNLDFVPRKMILRQAIYCNIAGADSGTYLIGTNLTNLEYIGAVYLGIQANIETPMTEVILPSNTQSITFTLTPANVAFTGPTGQLTMTVEFVA